MKIVALFVSSVAAAYDKLGVNTWTGPDGGSYLGNCKVNWSAKECPTAGWDAVLNPGNKVTYGKVDPNDQEYSEGDSIRIIGKGAVLRVVDGTFLLGGKQMTASPTPTPSQAPTPAPTPLCAVTCEHDTGQWASGGSKRNSPDVKHMGHKAGAFNKIGIFSRTLEELKGCDIDWAGKSPHAGCNWKGKRAGRIVSTHDTRAMNTQSSYTKHRCYTYNGKCVCDCLDDAEAPWDFNKDGVVDKNDNRFQFGTVQGGPGMAGKDNFKWSGQEIFKNRHSRYSRVKDGKLITKNADVPVAHRTPGLKFAPAQYQQWNGNWQGAGKHTVAPLEKSVGQPTGMDAFYDSR